MMSPALPAIITRVVMMSDSKLHHEGVNRLGNVLVPNDSYGTVIEKKILGLPKNSIKKPKNYHNGAEPRNRLKMRRRNLNCILAAKNDIPIIVPGPTDGSVGYQLWYFSQTTKTSVNI